uniref:Uncharacterized protein n=1 Tax=Heterorhabditis bacteriophora TaxID=37862 RepID=A0A1I7WG35_HETBA
MADPFMEDPSFCIVSISRFIIIGFSFALSIATSNSRCNTTLKYLVSLNIQILSYKLKYRFFKLYILMSNEIIYFYYCIILSELFFCEVFGYSNILFLNMSLLNHINYGRKHTMKISFDLYKNNNSKINSNIQVLNCFTSFLLSLAVFTEKYIKIHITLIIYATRNVLPWPSGSRRRRRWSGHGTDPLIADYLLCECALPAEVRNRPKSGFRLFAAQSQTTEPTFIGEFFSLFFRAFLSRGFAS